MSNTVTPRILAQRIIRFAERGNQPRDSQLEDREVIDIIIDISYKLAKASIYTARNEEFTKSPDPHYIFTFRKVPVKVMTSTGLNYVDVPASYPQLPYNSGIRFVFPNTDNPFKNDPMIPLQSGEQYLMRDIVGSMQKQWTYTVKDDKIYFEKKCEKTLCEDGIQYVDVEMVTILGNLLPDSPLSIPRSLHHDIVLGALEVLGPTYGLKQEKDKINDNNPDTLAR